VYIYKGELIRGARGAVHLKAELLQQVEALVQEIGIVGGHMGDLVDGLVEARHCWQRKLRWGLPQDAL
jgi:hypothetical protein